jgi:hypothetical protein
VIVRTAVVVVVLASMASVAPAAGDPPVTLHLADVTLASGAEFLSALTDMKVTAEEAVADRIVSLAAVDLPLSQAVAALAKAAGDDVEAVANDGGWRFRKKAPRSWTEVLEEKLKKKVTLNLEGTPLPEAIAFLTQSCGAGIVLDPAWISGRSSVEQAVTMSVEEATAKDAVALLAVTKGLSMEARWGVMFLATQERLAAVPKDLLAPPAADAPKAETDLREALRTPVNAAFEACPLSETLAFFGALKDLSIGMSEARERGGPRARPRPRPPAPGLPGGDPRGRALRHEALSGAPSATCPTGGRCSPAGP